MAATFQDQILRLADMAGAQQTNAAAKGVTAASSDNTAALLALATKYASTDPTRVTRLHLPAGKTIRGHLPMTNGVIWDLNGATIAPPAGGWTKHMVYPVDPAWIGATDGSGANRSGLVNGTINGDRANQSTVSKPIPQSLTVANITGSLTSGDYGYQVAYKSSFGVGVATEVQRAWGTTGAKLTWTNPAGVGDCEVVIFGRHAWDVKERRVLATLPAGTTTWSDTGAATPAGVSVGRACLSAASVVMAGACVTVRDLRVVDAPGSGFASWWDGDGTNAHQGQSWYRLMESRINNLNIEGSDGPGIVLRGPHDSMFFDLVVAGAAANSGLKDAIVIESGPWRGGQIHVWGGHRRGVDVTAPAELWNVVSEGAQEAALRLYHQDVQVHGGDLFYPKNSDRSSGLQIGDATFQPNAQAHGIKVRSGAADHFAYPIDLRHAGKGCIVTGTVADHSGTVVHGSPTEHIALVTVDNGDDVIWLPGYTPPVTATPTYTSETFMRANGEVNASKTDQALGGQSVTWAATTGAWTVDTGKMRRGASAPSASYALLPVPVADYDLTLTITDKMTTGWAYIVARSTAATATADSYRLVYDGWTVQIQTRVGGAQTNVPGTQVPVAAGDTVGIRVKGSTITMLVNGVPAATTTNTSLTAGGHAGIVTDTAIGTSIGIDNLVIRPA